MSTASGRDILAGPIRARIGRAEPVLSALAVGSGAGACVILAIGFASGRLLSYGGGTALAAVALFLLVAWCLTHQRVDQTLAAVALYLGLLDGYLKLRTGSSTVTLVRDALLFAIAAGALLRAVSTGRRLVLPPLSGLVLAFVAVVLVELANPASRGLTASIAGVRQHLEFVPLFFLGYAFVRTESQIRKALIVLVICAAAGGVVSYIQSRLSPDQLAAWGAGYAERIYGTGLFTGAGRVAFLGSGDIRIATVRPFGLGSEIGSGAFAAALAFPGLIALLMVARGRFRWALAVMSVGIGLAVATSGSRSALITVFVSLTAFGILAAASKNALKASVGLALGVALIYTAFVELGPTNQAAQRAQSITPTNVVSTFSADRGASVGLFPALAADHPLGVGLGTVGPAASVGQTAAAPGVYNAETEWNFLVIEVGIAGVLVYVALLLRLMWLAARRIRLVADPAMRLDLAALAAPIFGLFVAGFAGPTSASVPGAPYLWLVSGVLAYHLVHAYTGEAPVGQGLAGTGRGPTTRSPGG
jgi:intracellular septation protein A